MNLSPENMRIVYFILGFLLIGAALKFLRRMAGAMYSVIILAVYLIMNGFIKADSLGSTFYIIKDYFIRFVNFISPLAVNIMNKIMSGMNGLMR